MSVFTTADGERIAEFAPFPDARFGRGQGEKYVAFLANTLKPRVDRRYRTLRTPEHTAILGSSMGGLISLYAFFRHKHVFGAVGAMSPSLWFGERRIFDTAAKSRPAGRVYLDVGTKEGAVTLRDARELAERLTAAGYRRGKMGGERRDRSLLYVEDEGGRHSEIDWARRLAPAIRFLVSWPSLERNSPDNCAAVVGDEIEERVAGNCRGAGRGGRRAGFEHVDRGRLPSTPIEPQPHDPSGIVRLTLHRDNRAPRPADPLESRECGFVSARTYLRHPAARQLDATEARAVGHERHAIGSDSQAERFQRLERGNAIEVVGPWPDPKNAPPGRVQREHGAIGANRDVYELDRITVRWWVEYAERPSRDELQLVEHGFRVVRSAIGGADHPEIPSPRIDRDVDDIVESGRTCADQVVGAPRSLVDDEEFPGGAISRGRTGGTPNRMRVLQAQNCARRTGPRRQCPPRQRPARPRLAAPSRQGSRSGSTPASRLQAPRGRPIPEAHERG